MRSSKPPLLVLAATAVLLGAGSASAKDLCVYKQDGSFLVQLRGYRAPQAGKCRPVQGTHANGVLHGTVCRTSDGKVARFGTTTNIMAGVFSPAKVRQHAFSLAYPSYADGGGAEFTMEGGLSVSNSEGALLNIYAELCTASSIN